MVTDRRDPSLGNIEACDLPPSVPCNVPKTGNESPQQVQDIVLCIEDIRNFAREWEGLLQTVVILNLIRGNGESPFLQGLQVRIDSNALLKIIEGEELPISARVEGNEIVIPVGTIFDNPNIIRRKIAVHLPACMESIKGCDGYPLPTNVIQERRRNYAGAGQPHEHQRRVTKPL